MNSNKFFGITLIPQSKKDILEKIIKYTKSNGGTLHIVSINPENIVLAQQNSKFKSVIETAQIKIIDGVGIVLAARILGIKLGARVTGVELMEELIEQAAELRLRVLLIGGKPNLALELSECYSEEYPEAKFIGLEGISDIKKPRLSEEKAIFDIVRRNKPHMIFVAFGSPDQELWIERNNKLFNGSVVMGVGGAFDFISGKVKRAPSLIRFFGLEWLFRLIIQPWRWKRQIRLLQFIKLVILEKWKGN